MSTLMHEVVMLEAQPDGTYARPERPHVYPRLQVQAAAAPPLPGAPMLTRAQTARVAGWRQVATYLTTVAAIVLIGLGIALTFSGATASTPLPPTQPPLHDTTSDWEETATI